VSGSTPIRRAIILETLLEDLLRINESAAEEYYLGVEVEGLFHQWFMCS